MYHNHTPLRQLSNLQAVIILTLVGFMVYLSGLASAFTGDDIYQIVNNVPVHSIANIGLFFEGGTFYIGHGLSPLAGIYFRPLMTTTFSLLYSLFGAQPLYYHLLQLIVCIGSSSILYLFFRFSFKPALALLLGIPDL